MPDTTWQALYAKDVSKSAVGFIALPQTNRTASTFCNCCNLQLL